MIATNLPVSPSAAAIALGESIAALTIQHRRIESAREVLKDLDAMMSSLRDILGDPPEDLQAQFAEQREGLDAAFVEAEHKLFTHVEAFYAALAQCQQYVVLPPKEG